VPDDDRVERRVSNKVCQRAKVFVIRIARADSVDRDGRLHTAASSTRESPAAREVARRMLPPAPIRPMRKVGRHERPLLRRPNSGQMTTLSDAARLVRTQPALVDLLTVHRTHSGALMPRRTLPP